MISTGEEYIVSLVDEIKLSDTIRNGSQIYPQSYCGATMDAVLNSKLFTVIVVELSKGIDTKAKYDGQ